MKTNTQSSEKVHPKSLDTLVRRHRAAMKTYRKLHARANKRKAAAK